MTKNQSPKKPVTIEYLDEKSAVDRSMFRYFIGIDPSYSSTGLVVLDNEPQNIDPLVAKTIKAGNPRDSFINRIESLLSQLSESLSKYKNYESLTVMEGAAFASEFGAFKLGKLSGVLEYWLATHGYPYYLVAPMYAKKVASGKGNATKVQVINGVRSRWGYINKSNDINDAYTMARIAQGAVPEEPKKKKGKKKI